MVYVVTTFNNFGKSYQIYINGDKDNIVRASIVLTPPSFNITRIGGDPGFSNGRYFSGIIDEIKVYNRTLSEKEIKLNYYNYDSLGKGCCNYMILVNQNNLSYYGETDKVSSSSTLFYNNYNQGIWNNITLFKSTNFTTYDISDTTRYYNLLLDDCMFEAYNFMGYDADSQVYVPNAENPGEIGTNNCSNLIKKGIY